MMFLSKTYVLRTVKSDSFLQQFVFFGVQVMKMVKNHQKSLFFEGFEEVFGGSDHSS